MSLNEDFPPPPYSVEQAAKRTGLSKDAIRSAVREGRLPAFKIGREWLIHRKPLDRLLSGETAA